MTIQPHGSAAMAAFALLLASATLHAAGPAPLGCLMEPDRVAEVGSSVVGVIETVLVERGDRVRQGQVLAMLKADVERAAVSVSKARADSEADLYSAQANLEFARQKLARAEDLARQAFIATQMLEQIRAEAKVAEQRLASAREQQRVWRAEHDLAQQQLSQRAIRAPFSGIIAERYVTAGERIEEKPAFRIVKTDPLRVEVVVPSTMFGTIQAGSKAQILPDLPGAARVQAKVVLVDRVIDAASSTFRVRAEIPNADARLPSGLRCKAELTVQPVVATALGAAQSAVNQGPKSARARSEGERNASVTAEAGAGDAQRIAIGHASRTSAVSATGADRVRQRP